MQIRIIMIIFLMIVFEFALFKSEKLPLNKQSLTKINTKIKSEKSGFCAKYNCECIDPIKEIKCSLNKTTIEVEFLEINVNRLDLSDNSLEMLVWGDTALNLRELILRNNNISEIHEKMFANTPHLHYLDLSGNKISDFKEEYLTSLNVLESLNLSNAFVQDFKLYRHLCELVNLKIVDLRCLKT